MVPRAVLSASGFIAALVFLTLTAAAADEAKPNPDEMVFEMAEISAFTNQSLTRGQYAQCTPEPDKEVKAYPKLKSKQPLYGKLTFRSDQTNQPQREFHFVLDESGEAPPSKEENAQQQDAKPEETSLLKKLTANLLGDSKEKGAAKKPRGKEFKPSTYDRLYFDANGDLDLTNDAVVKAQQNPPWDALRSSYGAERTGFENLNLPIDYGPGVGVRPFPVFPWFMTDERGKDKFHAMFFVPATAREGTIKIGTQQYKAVLGQPYLISGRYDRPWTGLYLTPLDSSKRLLSHGFDSDSLYTMRRVGGELYTLTTTPLGDKLKVTPYRGEYGIFRIGAGGRDITDLSVRGSLRSETTAIEIGSSLDGNGPEEKLSECKIPVGDYLPSYLTLEYGGLRIAISDNYHADGAARNVTRQRLYGIKIRKDQPFVLDFSAKPEVLFASPAREQTFKPGDEISVKAVLVDPALDIMIRHLDDVKQKQKETVKLSDGRETSYERSLSLDPLVEITDAAGKTVAEGKMPFG